MFIGMEIKCAVVVVLLSMAAMVSASDKPIFNFSPSKCLSLLSSANNDWYCGCPTTLAVLLKSQFLTIHIDTSGDVVGTHVTLTINCPTSSSPITIILNKEGTTGEYCTKMKFLISHKSLNAGQHVYEVKLDDSTLDISSVFKSAIQLNVNVRITTSSGKEVVLNSKPLQIYSLDPLLNYGITTGSSFLTPTSQTFFKKSPYEDDPNEFPGIAFMDSSFLGHLTAMKGTFFESLLQIGGVIDLGSSACNVEQSKQLLILNRLANINYGPMAQIHYYLDSITGKLTFSKIGITNEANKLATTAGDKKASICVYVGLGNIAVFKRVVWTTSRYLVSNYLAMSQKNKCEKVPGNNDIERVTLYSGFSRFALKCPIVCDYGADIVIKHGDTRVSADAPDGEAKAVQNAIVFPEIVTKRHVGTYTCEFGSGTSSLQHRFDVSVVALPTFKDTSVPSNPRDGTLPSVVYAMEGETMSYACSVFYTGVNVALSAEFFYLSSDRGWLGPLDSNSYNSYLGCSSCATPTEKKDAVSGQDTMTLQVSKVPSMDKSTMRNFTHRFECHASVAESDVRPLNMNGYTATSGANIIYIPIPDGNKIIPGHNNNCSVQGCKPARGATFSYTFNPDFLKYLKSVQVKVTGYFMLDEINIDQLPVVNAKTKVVFSEADYSLKLIVPPITVEDKMLHDELLKRKTLTAVFNFAYNVTSLTGVTMDKSRYGKAKVGDDADCRSEKYNTCFYSTAFPGYLKENTMGFLTSQLDFRGDAAPMPATANTGMIVGILIAILIILVAVFLVAFLLMRDRGQTYLMDEKERQQGNNPEIEVKDEQFKEYQRPEEGPLKASRVSLSSSITVGSDDDHELDRYGDGDIDLTKFTEDGSFIGDYATDPRRKDAFNAAKSNEYTV